MRNNIKNRNKSPEEEEEESEVASPEVKSLLPTVTKKPKVTTIPTEWPDRLLNFPSFAAAQNDGLEDSIASDSNSYPDGFPTKTSSLYLPDESLFLNPVRSLPRPQSQNLFHHVGDEELTTSKKSRGLPILSQLNKRPVPLASK